MGRKAANTPLPSCSLSSYDHTASPITPNLASFTAFYQLYQSCDFLCVISLCRQALPAFLSLSVGHTDTETYRCAHTLFDAWSQSDFTGQCCDSLRILASLLSAHPNDKTLCVHRLLWSNNSISGLPHPSPSISV